MIDLSIPGECTWRISNLIGWRTSCSFNIRKTNDGIDISDMSGDDVLKNIIICPKCGKKIVLDKNNLINQVMDFNPRKYDVEEKQEV